MDYNNIYGQYAEFKQKQSRLASILEDATEVINELNMKKYAENLERLSSKVRKDSFKVQIVGTFKNGKSTFINSLLGEEVLPAYALPCTAIVNEVKWGAEKKAIVHFKNPLPEKLQSGIPEQAMNHMKKYNMRDIPPIEISYDEIEKYAVISVEYGKEEIEYESPYEKIEVFWPLPILKNGVEIIDSPGLNECETRTKVTMDYISKADAILFVLDATRIIAADEMRVIQYTLKEQGFDDPFIIVNKFDAVRDREKEPMKRYVREKLDGYTSNEFFFVSALNALDGKLDNDEELLKNSGMIEFEQKLSYFLTQQKGKAKLAQPTRELKRIINEEAYLKIIPIQKVALTSSVVELKERYRVTKSRISLYTAKKNDIYNRLLMHINNEKQGFEMLIRENIMNIVNYIPYWVESYEVKTKIGLTKKKEKIAQASKEISEHINSKIEEEQIKWKNRKLEPMINKSVKEIFGMIEDELTLFFEDIDNFNTEIIGQKNYNMESAWQRVASVVGGFVIGDLPGVTLRGNGRNMNFAGGIALEIASVSTLNILNTYSSFSLFTMAFGKSYSDSGEGKIISVLKEEISKTLSAKLLESIMNNEKYISDCIIYMMIEMADNIENALKSEIDSTESQIYGIIQEVERGEENIAAKKKRLEECESKIQLLNRNINELISVL